MIGYQVASQLRSVVNSSTSSLQTTSSTSGAQKSSSAASSSSQASSSHLDHDADDDQTPSPSPSPTPSASPHSSQAFSLHCNKMIKRELEAQSANFSNNNNNNNNVSSNHPNSLVSHQSYAAHQMALHQTSLANIEKLAASNGHLGQHHHHQHHQHLHNHLSHHLLPAAQSPGYHSAASSPCSSVDSPVSSSSSSGVGSTSSSTANNGSQQQQVVNMMSQQQHQVNSHQNSQVKSPFLLLDHFPETAGDGLRLTWFHEANSRSKLSAALMSTEMMVAGDISLAEMSRYPVPIMARPPLGVSDLTLENWLHELTQSQPRRGIKLTFTSTRTVEPAFRVLARHAEALKGPLILCADILTRSPPSAKGAANVRGAGNKQQVQVANNNQGGQSPNNQLAQPVDAWTFLMMCRTRFPKCTISIGWCPPAEGDCPPGGQMGVEADISTSAKMNGLSLPQSQQLPTSSSSSSNNNETSIFDLDLIDAHPALSQLISAGQLGAAHHVAHLGHLQHLTHQQHRPHHNLHPYPLAGNQLRQHQLHMRAGPNGARHHHHHHHSKSHHHIASSAGSLSGGSSGNSSGSPSPTSPTQLIMSGSPPYQTSAANLTIATSGGRLDSATERLLLSACSRNNPEDPSAAAAAAAAVTAALVAASNLQQQQQQMPLNLNINEAADRKQTFPTVDSLAGRLFSSAQQAKRQADHQAHRYPMSPLARQSDAGEQQQLLLRQAGSPPRAKDGAAMAQQQQQQQQQQAQAHSTGGYTRDMVDRMAALVKEYNLSQPVTFPVMAAGVLRDESLAELQRLLYQVGASSSLTIVAQPDDLISVDDLLLIRRSFGVGQLLFDLPDQLAAALRRECEH